MGDYSMAMTLVIFISCVLAPHTDFSFYSRAKLYGNACHGREYEESHLERRSGFTVKKVERKKG